MIAMRNRNCQKILVLHLLTWIPHHSRDGDTCEDLRSFRQAGGRSKAKLTGGSASHQMALVHLVLHLSRSINIPSLAPVSLSGVKHFLLKEALSTTSTAECCTPALTATEICRDPFIKTVKVLRYFLLDRRTAASFLWSVKNVYRNSYTHWTDDTVLDHYQ